MAAGEAVRAAERTARQGEPAGRVRGTGARSEDPAPGGRAERRAAVGADTAAGADTAKPAPARRFSRRVRKSVNSLHVVASVGLVGVEWGLIALGIVARVTGDAELRHTLYPVMRYLVYTTGMPLAVIALVSGVLLCLRTPWGLWRYLWIKVKIVLLFLVIAIGAGLMSRWLRDLEQMTAPGADAAGLAAVQWYQFAGAAVQLAALAVATFLSIFKPAGAAKGSAARRR
ncbi:hypothetical protein ACPA54_24190 [Uniformispora flossi]|uniref:hypothetical protein n=1 Tax=Uniformispora flossi TaxID=3390723 RepID=UPI003C30AE85